mgnify:CR=1 FL=1
MTGAASHFLWRAGMATVWCRELGGSVAQQFKPVVGVQLNSGALVRALPLALTSLVDTHVVPKREEIEIKLHIIGAGKRTAIVQELLEQPIDALDQTAGATGGVQDVGETLSQRHQSE